MNNHVHPMFQRLLEPIAPTEHVCTNHIDVRFHGAEDIGGELYCRVCGTEYSGEELNEMHAALQAADSEDAAA